MLWAAQPGIMNLALLFFPSLVSFSHFHFPPGSPADSCWVSEHASYLVCSSDNFWCRLDINSLFSEVWVEDDSKDDSNLKSFNQKSSSSRKMNLWRFKVSGSGRRQKGTLCSNPTNCSRMFKRKSWLNHSSAAGCKAEGLWQVWVLCL